LLNDSLFVYGGKTDQFNAYSYTSAPNTNDLLYISLTNSFSTAFPPWSLVNSSGPSLAWHTLSPSNLQNTLLFGGDPDSNSATVVVDIADSAQLLNLTSPLQPVWSLEPASWAGEPIRRMRHSTATSSSGQVFVIGGEMADGSGNAFSDHYVFDLSIPSFILLPPNGPPDIYGHASIIIPDGRLLVFGGYSSSQGTLLPFSMIWVLDTSQPNLAWTVIQTSIGPLPSPRMAFAAVSLDDGGILVHGGSSADLQFNFADGWILNTSQSSMSWTQVAALSQLGARRDHFAVCQGDQVLFGFGKCQTLYPKINTYNRINEGYENNGPAPSALQIYNTSSQSFVSLFEPPPPTQIPTNSQTGKSTNSATSQPPSTSTASTNPNNPGGSGTNNSPSTKTRTIAIGATLGALAVLAILLGSTYYLRRRQHERGYARFMALGGCDGANSPHVDGEIPVVDIRGDPVMRTYGGNRGLLTSLGLISAATKMRNMENTYQRRDMLADEDTRSFGEWYTSRSRDGTDGSSWSLKSILGGGTRLLSREASTASRGTNTGSRRNWREKIDPFADGTSSQDTNFLGVATASGPTRPRANGRRLMSYASSKSALSYRDPFSDPVQEEPRQRSDASESFFEEDNENHFRLSVRHIPVLPSTIPTRPLSQGSHTLSPLSEHISHHALTVPESSAATSSQVHSNETVMTPFGGTSSSSTSRTSVDPLPLSSSVTGTVHNDMRRTDSWWTRFSRTTLLDRRSSDASRMSGTSGRFEIRDPKPPPRLDAIVENIHLASRTKNSRPSQKEPLPHQPVLGRVASMVYNTEHGKSMSSLRTADSEAIERMAGTMDVFQRINTSNNSRRTTGSINSTGGVSIDTLGSSVDSGHDNHVSGRRTSQRIMPDDPLMFSVNTKLFSSPIEILPLQAPGGCDDAIEYSPPRPSSSLSTPSPPKDSPIRFISSPPLLSKNTLISSSSPRVTDRIHAFEKRIAREQTSSPLATNKYREERMKRSVTVDYGLVPRASLFVANPDSHRLSTSED
jgi:Galactose oxidase, central domain